MHWIRPLAEITLADIDAVGGKAAHLGAMMRAGFNVPEGFVIDIGAFVSHFGEQTDPLVKPNVPLLQSELMADVVQALLDHLGAEEQLAVRSSSTEEDSSHASFAGQHSTYYFVPPNRLDQAILDCWMSLWSSAALTYRRAGWAEVSSGEPVRMAVIVQKMLPAERSGVLFSRDPIDGASKDTVIEASWGLGAALVDGRVTPDHARLTEDGELVSYVVRDKKYQVSPAPGNPDAQRLQEVPRALREAAVLSTSEAQALANIGAQLETLFEAPQDIEWAYVGDELYLLQSRPITTRPAQHQFEQRLVLFKPLAENFTEPLTPLSEDMYAQVLPRIGAFYQGRCYLDLAPLERLNVFDIDETQLVEAALLRAAPESPRILWRNVARASLYGLGAFLIDGANWLRTANASPAALARYAALVDKIRRSDRHTPLRAMRRLVWGLHLFEPIGHQMLYANISAGRYFLYIGLLKKLVAKFAPSFPLSHLSRTYHGREDMQSMALLERIDDLGGLLDDTLRQDDDASTQVARVLAGEENALPPGSRFTMEFEDFLATYGHRGPREMELAAPTWRESPATLLKILHGSAASPRRANQTHGDHLAARDQLHRLLKPWQRRLVDRLTETIAKFIAMREDTRHYHIMAFAAVREKILQVEQELLRQAKLNVAGDVFFLRHAEMMDLLHDRLDPTSAHEIVRRRRRDWQRQSRLPPPETINVALPPLDPDAGLRGQCACPGRIEGTARVVHSLSEADKLVDGEILVAPYTDPAWTPLFTRAAGIVVGTGSFLSHAGTVARELHVPCVVDVKDCMHAIKNGQTLRLDATSGAVEILE